ncbi:MAG TPA: histidine kinase [Gemmatimonadales bacterium]|nr:histidine kinase [Gemmatimonadales bacterium]
MERRPTSAYPRWWLVLLVWAAWGLVLSTQVHIYSRLGSRPMAFLMSLRLNMPGALIWALFTPGIIWLGRRCPPFEGRRWPRYLALNFAASALAVGLEVLLVTVNGRLIRGTLPESGPVLLDVARSFVWWFPSDGLLYWAVLAIDYGVRHYRELKDRELRASQLEAQLAAARLEALQMQLQPHFLFNALHTIGQLVRTGQDATAVAVVAGLGDLLRRLLDGATAQEVPLRQELEFIQSYLEIEQIRFRDRLDARIDVPEDALDARVPHLILQPLVENAIRHGIAPRPRGGHVDVSAWRVGDRLHLAVWDDGAPLADTTRARNGGGGGGERGAADEDVGRGLGLANTSARVRQLYGEAGSFEMVDRPEGGVVAHVVIPFQLAAAEWQGASDVPGCS